MCVFLLAHFFFFFFQTDQINIFFHCVLELPLLSATMCVCFFFLDFDIGHRSVLCPIVIQKKKVFSFFIVNKKYTCFFFLPAIRFFPHHIFPPQPIEIYSDLCKACICVLHPFSQYTKKKCIIYGYIVCTTNIICNKSYSIQ